MLNLLKDWRITAGLVLILIALFSIGDHGKTSDNNTLIVGISPDYPPFESYQHGEIIGFDVDLINKMAQKMGKKVQLQPMNFDNLIGALESGKIDMAISGIAANEERSKNIDFSKVYYNNSFAIVYRNGYPLKSEEDLQGKKIGAQTGSTMDEFLKRLGDVNIFSLNNNSIMIEELKLGRIDGVLLEKAQAIECSRTNLSLRYQVLGRGGGDGYSIAFPKGSKLKNQVNQIIHEFQENGTLETITKTWIVEPNQPQQEAISSNGQNLTSSNGEKVIV